jgi:hypothetical protein
MQANSTTPRTENKTVWGGNPSWNLRLISSADAPKNVSNASVNMTCNNFGAIVFDANHVHEKHQFTGT